MILKIRSRHPSHDGLRRVVKTPHRAVLRLGSTTVIDGDMIEINTIDSIKKSSDKKLMKQAFREYDVPCAIEYSLNDDFDFPVAVKNRWGSRGSGNHLIKTKDLLDSFVESHDMENYIIEKFYSYNREYRLHISSRDGGICFYTCRKMLKTDTPEKERWYRNNSNSVWIMEDNPSFDKPNNWDDIVEQSANALSSVGLDIGAIDVRVQSSDKDEPKFIILETNSAPSFGDITLLKYKEELPLLINYKSL